jgi:hypothetical protein
MQKRFRPAPTAVLMLAVAAAALAAGCSSSAGSPAGTADRPRGPTLGIVTTAPVPAPPTDAPQTDTPRPVDRAPTAADSLAAFFAAARADDARIGATARAVNREIGPTSVHFSRATLDTFKASAPDRTARAMPAGMDADMLRSTLIVYRELAARSAAFNPVLEIGTEVRPRTDSDVARFLDALRRGSLVARAYPADLAAARALAAANPPIAPARPDSRAAAELAIRIAQVQNSNNGCLASGAPVLRYLVPIVWKTTVTVDGRPHDGSIGGIVFHVAYAAGSGWTAALDAC